jgi:predicted metal-dependent peptidase
MSEFTPNKMPTETKEVSEKAKKELTTAKINLIRAYPFMGFLVMTCGYKFSNDIPTMAATTIGGNKVFVNEEFMLKTLENTKQIAFVVAHEVMHIFLEHVGRGRDMHYHPELWNVATDYCINGYLANMNDKLLEMPKFALYDTRFKGMSADQIYNVLLKEAKDNAKAAAAKHGGNSIGCGDQKTKRPFDVVSDESVSEESRLETKRNIAAAVGQAGSEEAVKQMGQGAADLLRMFREMIAPRIPWQKVLREYVSETVRSRYTYQRISRRSTPEILFPSMTGEHLKLLVGVDTSGSMSERDLSDAMSELKGICDNFESWDLTLLSCDTNAHVIGMYNSEEGDDFSSIDKNLIGGGGTDMNPMIEYGNELEEKPSVMVIMTDGYIPPITTVEDIDVILVVTRNGNKELEDEQARVLFMNDEDD